MALSGVYKITNTTNDKIYIGSSVNIKQRWAVHFFQLRKNSHANSYLQKSYNKYGENVFKTEVLFTCPKSEVLRLEQYCINNYLPEYNLCKIAGNTLGIKRSEKSRKAQSERMKGNNLYRLFMAHKRPVKKEKTKKKIDYVCQIDTDSLAIINKFSTIEQAKKETGLTSISSVICGKNFKAGDYTWSYESKYNKELLMANRERFAYRTQSALILTLCGNIVKKCDSLKEVAKYLDCDPSTVQQCCKGRSNTLLGHIVIYEKDYTPETINNRLNKLKHGPESRR